LQFEGKETEKNQKFKVKPKIVGIKEHYFVKFYCCKVTFLKFMTSSIFNDAEILRKLPPSNTILI